MKKRHEYVSPTLDLMAKKIFSLPEVTAKLIREVLDLPVESFEILEGDQIHEQGFLGDLPFETSVDVRARLDSGLEVIIEIQVLKQDYFLNRFHYYLANQLVENVQRKRKKGATHSMYQKLEPVYGIAILERSIFPHLDSPVNVYEMRHTVDGTPLYSSRKDGVAHNMLKVAFLELDKYNESRDTELNAHWRQWLEFFGNRPFSHQPDQVIEQAESLLIPSNWTREEKEMIDERIRIRENWEMSMDTFRKEQLEAGFQKGLKKGLEQGLEQGLERGLERGLEQGLERGLEQGLEQGRQEGMELGVQAGQQSLIQKLSLKGMSIEMIAEMTDLSRESIKKMLATDSSDEE